MSIIESLPVQFAVVREDPRIEERVLRECGSQRALLIGSGGCTALHLRAAIPELPIELIDPNPAQLAHVQAKLDALAKEPNIAFNRVFCAPGRSSTCNPSNLPTAFR